MAEHRKHTIIIKAAAKNRAAKKNQTYDSIKANIYGLIFMRNNLK